MTQLQGTPRSCVWPHLSQRDLCHGRQQRTGLPAHLLAQLDSFVQNPVPGGPNVALIGEFTPFNLLHQDSGLSAMLDFGDGLVGPREYDWLGPLCCLAAGDATRIDAFSTATSADRSTVVCARICCACSCCTATAT